MGLSWGQLNVYDTISQYNTSKLQGTPGLSKIGTVGIEMVQ